MSDQDGQVSDVSGMDPAESDTPIQPDQATQGAPDMESGDPQTDSEAGPGAKPDQEINAKDRGPGQKSPSSHPPG